VPLTVFVVTTAALVLIIAAVSILLYCKTSKRRKLKSAEKP
jgi:hypothetical protein